MRHFLIFCFLTVVGCKKEPERQCNYIRDYYPTIYLADYEFEIENYQKAFELYQKAFNACDARKTVGYNEIGKFTETTAHLKKYALTYDYAKKEVLMGVLLSRFENNKNLKAFLLTDYGKMFFKEYVNLRKTFLNSINLKLRRELVLMGKADKKYRGKNNELALIKQDSIDNLHEKRLIEIFESVGFPSDEIIGPRAMTEIVDIGLLLLHTKDSIRMNYFVPKIKEFVKLGKVSPRVLGTIIDQYYLYNDESQIYGTYFAQDGGYANMIEDLKKVDSNRISIGLSPLTIKEKKDSLSKANYKH